MNVEKALLKAIHDYSLIKPGDRILIGASGGKDSLALSFLLSRLVANRRLSVELGALKVIISPHCAEGLQPAEGFASAEGLRPPEDLRSAEDLLDAEDGSPITARRNSDELPAVPEVLDRQRLHQQQRQHQQHQQQFQQPHHQLAALYSQWGIPLKYSGIRAPDGSALGCYRCSSLRRQALASYALEEGYTSIALGHHLDDILTTALMNMVAHGSAAVMKPRRHYEKLGLLLIRPLAYVPEESLRRLAACKGWQSVTCSCPFGLDGDRAEFRRRLDILCGNSLSAKLKLLRALGLG
jgi:tRNA(Ile)-lysidine synthase TilS/MesJ